MRALCLAAIVTALGSVAVPASTGGQERAAQPATDHAVGFYDSRQQRVTLVGGPGDPLHDGRDRVWTWSGERWEASPETGPPGRVNGSAAYDSQRGRAVVAGGSRKTATAQWQVVGDTWQRDQDRWWPIADIPARDHHALVEGADGRILMFGGIPSLRSAAWPGDTWELHDGTWRLLSEAGPSPRGRTALAYDRARRQIVLFGGVSAPAAPNGPQTFLGDTWLWDGTRWQQAAGGPPGRYAHGMVYDEGAGVVWLYSGAAAHKGAPLSDMWQWDGTRWTEIPLTGATPGYRYQPVMVYDRARGKTVLYGGVAGANDTWEWDRQQWRRIVP